MKPLSVEMACLLGIQNEIQAVCGVTEILTFYFLSTNDKTPDQSKCNAVIFLVERSVLKSVNLKG